MADFSTMVPERTTRRITFTLNDEAGVAIPGTNLATCTLKLFDAATAVAIGTATRNVLGSVNAQGLLSQTFVPDDNPILDDTLVVEAHVALFEWTYNPPNGRGQFVVLIGVVNQAKVP